MIRADRTAGDSKKTHHVLSFPQYMMPWQCRIKPTACRRAVASTFTLRLQWPRLCVKRTSRDIVSFLSSTKKKTSAARYSLRGHCFCSCSPWCKRGISGDPGLWCTAQGGRSFPLTNVETEFVAPPTNKVRTKLWMCESVWIGTYVYVYTCNASLYNLSTDRRASDTYAADRRINIEIEYFFFS